MYLRRWRVGILGSIGVLMSLMASTALACTTIALGLPHRPLIAYSFDYAATGAGMVFANPAPAVRSSIMDGNPARWTVRHASVTFNQMGPGMPAAGMNSAGLVVSLMWNDGAVFAGDEEAPVVTELEFIQRLLDTAASVDEALSALQEVRILGFVPIHYFLADRSGNAAIVTPTVGGLTVHTPKDMPIPALTNTSYTVLTERLKGFEGFGGEQPLPSADGDPDSLSRFLVAAEAVQAAGDRVTPAQAFSVLGKVANQSSRWNVVFDPTEGRVVFKIVGQPDTIRIAMSDMNFRCRERPLAMAMADVMPAANSTSFSPAAPAAISGVSRQVLASLPKGAGLAPEMADALTDGLLAAFHCEP